MHTVVTRMPSICTLTVTKEPSNGISRLPDGDRPEDFRIFYSLMCKNILLFLSIMEFGEHTQFYPWLGRMMVIM